jgi:glycosyltransferase involved in cell wall biosynthesis
MAVRIGSEITGYRLVASPTGIPRMMREAHRVLRSRLELRGAALVPVVTRDHDKHPARERDAYLASDPLLWEQPSGPENVDALILLEPSPRIDYARITRVRRERRFPVVGMIVDVMPILRPEWFYAHAQREFRVLTQQVLHVSDHIIVPSEHVLADLKGLGWEIPHSTHVIQLGTAFDQRPPRTFASNDIHLVYVSTIDPRKGHQRLVDVFDRLRADGLAVTLTLIGRYGWCMEDFVTRLRSHPEFGSTLIWLDHTDDSTVLDVLARSTLAVIPSEGEGFGYFLEEALSAGLVVVVNDIPVFRERPYRNVVFADNSTDGLERGIRSAIERRPEALEVSEVRTMNDFGNEMMELIDDILEEEFPDARA